jgi:uncharacterized cupredoxin-like copper-binding protein
LLLLLALVWLTAPRPALAVYPPPAKDGGMFFKPETIQKADKKIRSIYQNYRKDVIVETFLAVPPALEKKFRADHKITSATLTRAETAELFDTWAKQREEELGLNGVYILICKKPGHIHVGIDAETRKKALPIKDRDKLAAMVLEKFKAGNFDAGLLAGIEFVESALKANLE